MAKIARETHKIFGDSGTSGNFTQFGSTTGGSTNFTKDIATIQALGAWANGWQEEVFPANKAPFLEDMNAWCYEHSYQVAYLFQEGIPEWDDSTTYFIGSIVQKTGTSPVELYESLVDNNLNQALPSQVDNANWRFMNPQPNLTAGYIVKATGQRTLGNSVIRESGGNIGVGAAPTSAKLSANGIIESTSGGIKFPDATVQTTAGISAATGIMIQSVSDYVNVSDSTTANIPFDGSIPQISEGKQFASVTITPKFASSKLRVKVFANIDVDGPEGVAIAAFRDGAADAVAAATQYNVNIPAIVQVIAEAIVDAGSTDPTTFTARYGTSAGGGATARLNSSSSYTPIFGGVLYSYLTVEEILP